MAPSSSLYLLSSPLLHVTQSLAMSQADNDRLLWSQIFAIRTLHEANLQSLLSARNYTVLQLLSERNQLLCERYLELGPLILLVSLSHLYYLFCHWRGSNGGPSIEFSDTDFILPSDPEAVLPYIITPSGGIVPFRSGCPLGGFYPGVVRFPCSVCSY